MLKNPKNGNMKRKIAVVVEYFPPRLGGDRRIFEIMNRLSDKYDVHFFIVPPSYTLFIRKIDKHAPEETPELIHYAGMTGHNIGIPQYISKLWDKGFLLAFAVTMTYLTLQLTKKIANLKPDIIIINQTSVYTGLLGFISSKALRRKLLVEYNDLQALYTFDMVQGKIPKNLQTLAKAVLMAQEDLIVKRGWRVIAITNFIKQYASDRKTRFDIKVIPDGVDTSSFNPSRFDRDEIRKKFNVRNTEKLCLYAGRIERVSGSGILVETAKLMETQQNIKFMIVGEGNAELVNEFKKRKNTICVGAVPKEEVPKYLAAADIVLVPFPKSIASHSISPLKLFEALSMEKPVVASNISGIEEVVQSDFYGALVSDDPNHWALAITKIANDNENLHQRRKNREIVVKKYDWALLAEQFSEIIEEKSDA